VALMTMEGPDIEFTTIIGGMPEFTDLLRRNRNYRYTWLGEVVSETGDYFNNIAVVFSLVMEAKDGKSRALESPSASRFAKIEIWAIGSCKFWISSSSVRP